MRATKCGDQYDWNWSKVEDKLFIGTLPRLKSDLEDLRDTEGVMAVLTMNESWELVLQPEDIESIGMSNLVVGTPDYSAPSLRKVKMSVQWAMEATLRGEGVYVHCNAGRGRSCVVVLCIMMLRFGMDALDAYEFVAKKRRLVKLPSLCETKPQWRVVREFEAWLHSEEAAALPWTRVRPEHVKSVEGNPLVNGAPPDATFESISIGVVANGAIDGAESRDRENSDSPRDARDSGIDVQSPDNAERALLPHN